MCVTIAPQEWTVVPLALSFMINPLDLKGQDFSIFMYTNVQTTS